MMLRNMIDRPSMHRLALGGAWFFVVVSLLFLVWAAATLMTGGPGADATFYQTVADGQSMKAIGLSYVGAPGFALVVLQGAVVIAAAAASTFRRDKWRRIGHAVLVSWAALWALNLTWLTSVDPSLIGYGQSLTMTALLGFTMYRAMRGWSAPKRRGRRGDLPADDVVAQEMRDAAAFPVDEFEAESLSSVDISHSVRMREVQRDDVPADSRWQRIQRRMVRLVQLCCGWIVTTAERAWPVIHKTALVVGGWVQRMLTGLIGYLRAHGFVPHRSEPAARVE